MMIGRLRPIIGLKTEFLLGLTYGLSSEHEPLKRWNTYDVVLKAHPSLYRLSSWYRYITNPIQENSWLGFGTRWRRNLIVLELTA